MGPVLAPAVGPPAVESVAAVGREGAGPAGGPTGRAGSPIAAVWRTRSPSGVRGGGGATERAMPRATASWIDRASSAAPVTP